ncbi:hypothetical protein BDY17DRAFT_301470 [Neohortaea acidophila]|uniref:Tat pathway signal sequence n=1 Tax=Neohortaea acidophila TaxID=245834 RepID=A0A6A6PQJ6_9PEZI|nr:uncharacterized protein BDY17DRAFT_301470 [Neohortaea acidophila]KAF2481517.1 hypothetical protein BDY17DRAFT_301470 [Neohortaea acidophila]
MVLKFPLSLPRYTPLQEGGEVEENKCDNAPSTSLANGLVVLTYRAIFIFSVVWILATALITLITVHWLQIPACQSSISAIRAGEFVPAKDTARVKNVRFTESSTFNFTAVPPRQFREDVRIYVGEPSPALDRNWDDLLDNQYFYITEQEARSTWGEDYQKYWRDEATGHYRVGIDVLHTLHCLNIIRKEVYSDYYRARPYHGLTAELQLYHVDHCIDIIRQGIQCSSDLTPVPVTRFDPITGQQSVDSEHTHTCRDFSAIREWMTLKAEESKVLDQDILERAKAGARSKPLNPIHS